MNEINFHFYGFENFKQQFPNLEPEKAALVLREAQAQFPQFNRKSEIMHVAPNKYTVVLSATAPLASMGIPEKVKKWVDKPGWRAQFWRGWGVMWNDDDLYRRGQQQIETYNLEKSFTPALTKIELQRFGYPVYLRGVFHPVAFYFNLGYSGEHDLLVVGL